MWHNHCCRYIDENVIYKSTMNRLKFILVIICWAVINIPVFVVAQSTAVTDRTPEQEALKQTEKLQNELQLTEQQYKAIYQINLRYARERQQSNTRSQAVERIRNKNEDIQKVLSPKQYDELQNRKNEVKVIEIDNANRYVRTNPQNRVNSSDQRSVRTGTGNTDFNTAIRILTPMFEVQQEVITTKEQ
ncbi:MAG: hypothetical protein H6Q19_2110 [Bacteroidetes bacterium]|nr:hypothetical protein [Bacteroidota bacterium]